MPKLIPEDVKVYIANRYDELFSELNQEETLRKIRHDVNRRFGIEVSEIYIRDISSRKLIDGTHLHNFFDVMISDFKGKYGNSITEIKPQYLLSLISNFIEKGYDFSGKLDTHERCVLSRVLDDRKDVIFTGSTKKSAGKYRGESKGKPGYFI